MTPYELMLSESQERMLMVAQGRQGRRMYPDLQEVGSGCGGGRDR